MLEIGKSITYVGRINGIVNPHKLLIALDECEVFLDP
jgi:hypothetical protein